LPDKPLSRVNPELKMRAREFRRNPTPAEQLLWNFLRCRDLDGFKFRRQVVIGPFIVDFYCPAKQLVIEIDGLSHADQGLG
jgi:very-short-patch-repair endonuclease